jgi:hypothetical protein
VVGSLEEEEEATMGVGDMPVIDDGGVAVALYEFPGEEVEGQADGRRRRGHEPVTATEIIVVVAADDDGRVE